MAGEVLEEDFYGCATYGQQTSCMLGGSTGMPVWVVPILMKTSIQ